jgi:hypothetical protein
MSARLSKASGAGSGRACYPKSRKNAETNHLDLAGDGGIRGAKIVTAATARRRNFKSPVRPVLAVKRSVLTENRTKNAYGRPWRNGV